MLIEFTIANYRSFREPATISMVAAKLKAKDERLDRNNVFQVDHQPALLTSAAIFGRNASGKSNLVRALAFMRAFVLRSSSGTDEMGAIGVEPFLLSTVTIAKPSLFEIVFVSDGTRYRYGFELTKQRVTSEWLYAVPRAFEALQFHRDLDTIKIGRTFKEGRERIQLTRPNALFLSVLAQFNAPVAQKLLAWFKRLDVVSGVTDAGMQLSTMQRLLEKGGAETIARIVTALDTGVEGLRVEEGKKDEVRTALADIVNHRDSEQVTVNMLHTVYDGDGRPVQQTEFEMDGQESEGTRRLFALAGPLSTALTEGRVLIVDEFDARLHPLLTRRMLQLFNDPATNPKHAQLVFVTHDSGLLDNLLLRRDQIWFVEKDTKGASTLYSLAEFKGVRNDKDYESGYLGGRYGAIPYVDSLAEAVAVYEVDDAKEE